MINIFDQLRDFRFTENGRQLLRTIPKSILFKAKKDFDNIRQYVPCYQANTYYAICLRFCEIQKCYPDWSLAGEFDINQPITIKKEKFSMRLVLRIERHLEKNPQKLHDLREKLLFLNPDGSSPNPMEPLTLAIMTGGVNIKGLKFLRGCFATKKPKLVHEINKYIYKVEQEMIDNIKSETDDQSSPTTEQKNISCINVESVL